MSKVEALEEIVTELRLNGREKRELAQWLQRAQMQRWNKRLDALFARVDARQKGLPRLTMPEIVQEVKAVRRGRASRRRP